MNLVKLMNQRTYAVKTRYNNIHLIHLDFDEPETTSFHVIFSLYDIIPDELIKIYVEYYALLVSGYIKQYIDIDISEKNIPNVLKSLIASFYPCFV